MATTPKLAFSVRSFTDLDGKKKVSGTFSRDWDEEDEMDGIEALLEAGEISLQAAIHQGYELLKKNPDNLEYQNFVGCKLWDAELRELAAEQWEAAYLQASALIPKDFKGEISWYETDNRSFLRCCYGHVLGLMQGGKGRGALAVARKLLRWNPDDNQGVRFLIGDLQMMAGQVDAALKTFLKTAGHNPVLWYSAALAAFRKEEFVDACTYLRRGIAGNPYIAEGVTGRTLLDNHLYWHSSNIHDTDFAVDYLNSPHATWSDEETDFVDWVFNSSAVLKERAERMVLHETLTYVGTESSLSITTRGEASMALHALRENIDGEVSKVMVRQVRNRWGDLIWPWDREGFRHPVR